LAQLREKDAELATLRDQVQQGSYDHNQMTNGTLEKHKKTVTISLSVCLSVVPIVYSVSACLFLCVFFVFIVCRCLLCINM